MAGTISTIGCWSATNGDGIWLRDLSGQVWGAGVDLVIDNFSRIASGIIEIISSLYCDVAVRFPGAFAFSEIDSLGQPPPIPLRQAPEVTVKTNKGGKAEKPVAEGPFR